MSEDKQPVTAIKGTHDILPKEARAWQMAEAVARVVFELYGYREIRTPVFEATELFEKGTGQTSDIVQKEMYTFTDKGGRSITLRPEYTPSVARAIIEHRLDLKPEPMRYYFIGPMFRFDKPQKGRFRQFHQVDIEVFGEDDPAIDAEIVEMADHLLKKLGVTETETLVNSVGCRKCRPAYLRELRAAAAAVESSLCPDCRRKAVTNPLRIFDCKVESCRDLAAGFPEITNSLCPECAGHFEKFRAYLELYHIPHRIEPRLVRGIDYYTKTTFEITTAELGAQNSILGGGRYDDMMRDFGGPDICGIGFAMGVERLLAVADLKPALGRFVFIAHLGETAKTEAIAVARFLRQNNIECLLEFKEHGLKAQLGRANKLGASWTLIIGEDEIRKGRYQLKDMKTGSQTEAAKEDIPKLLGGC
ncbi:MAG: histidine--tRNA ligase [Candidatus Aminicenantes bacterium]|nr:histidine--tRNA ligase [Candidatus Aminicenantes bacterium]